MFVGDAVSVYGHSLHEQREEILSEIGRRRNSSGIIAARAASAFPSLSVTLSRCPLLSSSLARPTAAVVCLHRERERTRNETHARTRRKAVRKRRGARDNARLVGIPIARTSPADFHRTNFSRGALLRARPIPHGFNLKTCARGALGGLDRGDFQTVGRADVSRLALRVVYIVRSSYFMALSYWDSRSNAVNEQPNHPTKHRSAYCHGTYKRATERSSTRWRHVARCRNRPTGMFDVLI